MVSPSMPYQASRETGLRSFQWGRFQRPSGKASGSSERSSSSSPGGGGGLASNGSSERNSTAPARSSSRSEGAGGERRPRRSGRRNGQRRWIRSRALYSSPVEKTSPRRKPSSASTARLMGASTPRTPMVETRPSSPSSSRSPGGLSS